MVLYTQGRKQHKIHEAGTQRCFLLSTSLNRLSNTQKTGIVSLGVSVRVSKSGDLHQTLPDLQTSGLG